MRRTFVIPILVAAAALLPAMAGEGRKCTAGTQECLDHMARQLENRGLVGVDGEWDDSMEGFRIDSFLDGTEAIASGVRIGDLLVAINGIALSDSGASKADAPHRTPGSKATITVLRDGKRHTMKLRLIGMSETLKAAYVGSHMLEHADLEMAEAD